MPLGFDALVIVLSATYDEIFWIFPPLIAAASLIIAALTYWVGRTAGFASLPRLIPAHHLERLKTRLHSTGAGTVAVAAVMPPPFPLTPLLLTCGALDLDRRRIFLAFGAMRLVRFGGEALLARQFGDQLLEMLNADGFQAAGVAMGLVTTVAALAFAAVRWRRTRASATGVKPLPTSNSQVGVANTW